MDSKIKLLKRSAIRAKTYEKPTNAISELTWMHGSLDTMAHDDTLSTETKVAIADMRGLINERIEELAERGMGQLGRSQEQEGLLKKLQNSAAIVDSERSLRFSEEERAEMISDHRRINQLLAEISAIANDASSTSVELTRKLR